MKKYINAFIYQLDHVLEQASLTVEHGRITAIEASGSNVDVQDVNDLGSVDVIDVNGAHLVPGFIDVHVHGGGGVDVMSGSASDVDTMSRFHAAHGTTAFLPTTMTQEESVLEQAVRAVATAMVHGTSGAEVLGIHVEGPFLNVKRCGAQNPQHIRAVSKQELNRWIELSNGNVRCMTIAPELEGAIDLIRYAVQQNIAVSIGHSDAELAVVEQALSAGATQVTHLFNGMRGLHHREPGVAGAGLMLDELAVEIICDGLHIHRDLIRHIFQVKPAEQIMLITDCVAAGGMGDGEYDLGGLPIVMHDGQVRLRNDDGSLGSLAGSTLTMDQALRNAMQFTGLSLFEILPALTINPARQAGVAHTKGSLEIGKDADFVLLDDKYEVIATYVKGEKVFGENKS